MDAGASADSVAHGFVGSSVFASVYSKSVSNGALIDKLYQNVLGRAGETAGTNYWVRQLESGLIKEHALAAFSESAENQAHVTVAIADGIWYV